MNKLRQQDPVVMRSCDVQNCRRVRLLGLAVAAVGIAATVLTGHQAVLAIVILGFAFAAQSLVC